MGVQYRYQNWRREGTRSLLHGLTLRATKSLLPYRELRVMQLSMDRLTPPDAPLAELPYETRFLDASEVARFSDQAPALRAKFTNEAEARGDRCYAIIDGERLASFGWYATRPLVVAFGMYIHFDPSYVYMHTGYTHPDYRGQRLHGIGKAKALRVLADEGIRGMLSCVDADNVNSLRSCQRLGCRPCGVIRVLRGGNRPWSLISAGCAEYGVSLSPMPDRAALPSQSVPEPATEWVPNRRREAPGPFPIERRPA